MKDIAISKANFEELIEDNFIYVDKTKFLHKITTSREPYYFLSRPRRFGKTLFVDTLEKFYQGKKELFVGLYIYNQDWDWEEYPVVHLDFNMIPSENREIMEKSLQKTFAKIADQYDTELKTEEAYYMFPNLIENLHNKFDKGVVVLIDEYDKPVISTIDTSLKSNGIINLNTAHENQKFLKILYDNLKALEPYLEKVFITGVSKFSKLSIFSTLNNLIELDQDPEFAEIMGYTEEELDKYFSHYFEKLAENNNLTLTETKNKFRNMYNGFRFTEKDSRVYNPFSVGSALKKSSFDNYWFQSGTPSFLVELIREKNFDVSNLENIEVGRDEIKAYDIEKLELIPLLFQTGYLTIKDIEDQIIYRLGYPNLEVEKSFTLNLAKTFSENKITIPVIHRLKKSFANKDFEKFTEQMKSIFANLANINIPKSLLDREHYYHSIFYLTGVLLSDDNFNVYSEILTSEGRIDMLVETEADIFIVEFKCNQSAEKAIKQIKDKNYADSFKLKNKEIILIGINFDTEKRNIKDIKIEKKD
jgi:hypothetical protein